MTALPKLEGPVRTPRSGSKPKQLIMLLHGWGADGPNLIDLADVLSPILPDAQFVAPNAPYPCEANPFGYQWFSLMDRQPQHMLEGARKAADIVNAYLDEQLASLSLDNSNLALIGFSQGTMTALHVAMRRSPQIAAMVGFSGALIGAEVLAKEITARPPVCLIHGEMDDVVPYGSLAHATDNLTQVGVKVEAHSRPFIGHSIDMEGLKAAAAFLQLHVQ
jgi:phospholipase/carboxylesterase